MDIGRHDDVEVDRRAVMVFWDLDQAITRDEPSSDSLASPSTIVPRMHTRRCVQTVTKERLLEEYSNSRSRSSGSPRRQHDGSGHTGGSQSEKCRGDLYIVLRRPGVRLEIVERDELERGRMRRLEYGGRRGAASSASCSVRRRHTNDRPAAAQGRATAAAAWTDRSRPTPRTRGIRRHDRADRVEARVTTLGAAMAVSEEAGERIERARLQLTAEDVHS